MIKLTGWRALALLAVTCGLFLAADAVPKPVTLDDASARMTDEDVRHKIAVPLLRKLAKYSPGWNEFLLFGTVNENDTGDQLFEREPDMFDTALLDAFTTHLVEETTDEELEEMREEVWHISAKEMEKFFVEAGRKRAEESNRMVATAGSRKGTEHAIQRRPDDVSERLPIFPAIVIAVGLLLLTTQEAHAPGVDDWDHDDPLDPFEPHDPRDDDYDDGGGGGRGGGGGSGSGSGDPHMTGFDGRKFLLVGDAVNEYNLFSRRNVAVKARLYVDKEKTFFREFRVVSRGDLVVIDMDPASKTVAVSVNGVRVDRDDLHDTPRLSVKTQPVGKNNLKATVSTPMATFVCDTKLYKRPHLDFTLELAEDMGGDEPDGILGHTLRRGAEVPHPADMAPEEIVARYAANPLKDAASGTA